MSIGGEICNAILMYHKSRRGVVSCRSAQSRSLLGLLRVINEFDAFNV